jgi:predicted secreted Zn-dependent protease
MPMLRRIKIAVITASMVNPVRSWKVRAPSTAQSKAAEVAAPLMILGNSGRECVPAIDTREGSKGVTQIT